jgi:hypothetical protein
VGVEVEELDGHLLEGALRQQVALDARQRLVRVVVGLRGRGRGGEREVEEVKLRLAHTWLRGRAQALAR